MKLVIIFGPPAVGKMTVGLELVKQTGLKLFHNHMTIEPLLGIFEFDSPEFQKLNNEFRKRIFEEVAQSDLRGLIFTFVWNLDDPKDTGYIQKIREHFESNGASIYLVELFAPLEERLNRNETPLRLQEKASKRDVEQSKSRVIHCDKTARTNSNETDIFEGNYIKIDNTNLTATEVAQKIKTNFNL